MASLAELQDALMNADKAGDTAAARQLADAIHSMRSIDDAKPAAAKAGAMIGDIGRQVGLTARYGLESLANTAQIATEPIRYASDRLTGNTGKTMPLGAFTTQMLDKAGFPSPEGANERAVAEGTRLGFGAGGLAKASQMAAKGATGAAEAVLSKLGQSQGQQIAAGAGAGLSGGAVKENDGGFWAQFGASVAGGVAGGMSASGVNAAKDMFNAVRREIGMGMSPQQIDAKINVVLQRAGVDYSQVPERLRQGMRRELQSALESGKEVSPAATARLLDFQRTGTTPTRGMLSQNPVQITREMNLAKISANQADDSLTGLPLIQNRNNTRLIENLNEAGANRGDMFRAGQSSIDSIARTDAGLKRSVTGLYDDARAMPGGNTQLDRAGTINRIYGDLARENKMAYLPDDIGNTLNAISKGRITRDGQTFDVPFDANALDNLMTDIARAQRSTQDGNVKAALSIARSALDSSPITPIKNTFGGNQVVTQPVAQAMRNADGQAGEFMGALNDARSAARQRFQWQESSRPVEAALGGAQPDNFVKNFVIKGSLSDATAVSNNAPVGEVKNAIVNYLKDKAIGGAADEYGKFSQSAYRKALTEIGDRKLALFFDPQEIAHLRSIGNAASAMQVQPVGSAVNNSNSGALMVGKALDALKAVANKLPFGESVVTRPLNSIEFGLRTRQAQNFRAGLLSEQSTPLHNSLLLPGAAMGGLLAAP